MKRIGGSIDPCRLLCVIALVAVLAACGFGRDPDARSGSDTGEDTGLMAKVRSLALEQVCKHSSACDDEESREAIEALGEILQQLPGDARRQLAESDQEGGDITRADADDAPPLSGAGLAGLMEMARSMLEADGARWSPAEASMDVDSSDAASTDVIGPKVAGPELVARLEGIPVRIGSLTPAELLSRMAPLPTED